MNDSTKIKAVDLFCGIGGLTNGLQQGGIDVVAGFDIDHNVKYTYEKNNNAIFYLEDITKLKAKKIKKLLEGNNYTLVAGCAPCQPFSSFQKEKNVENRKNHYKYPAFEHFIRIVKEVKPHFVTMENVQGIAHDSNFKMFVKDLKIMNYNVDYSVINIANYGAPQNRRRLLLIGCKKEIGKIKLPLKLNNTKPLTIKEAIEYLPKLKNGQIDKYDPLHRTSRLSKLNLERIKNSKPGGTWRDWPKELLPNCYKKETGKTFSSVYGRLSPNKPSNTLTTQFTRYGTGRYGHFEQDRALSLREGSILQTFPKNYDFNVEKLGITKVALHIGNAVPPIVGKIIGKTMKGILKVQWKDINQE